jgi:SAM-dependent methyltransferase
MNDHYGDRFYLSLSRIDYYNGAKIVLEKTLMMLPKIDSAVDFGCGVGTWLAVLQEFGVKEIKGYDGPWVNKEMLMIPKECFTEIDLTNKVVADKKYDLAISVEVAEHLPPDSAELFIESIVKTSDIVLFSAAIPFQGGSNHINEQWPDYWNKIFNKHGYIAMDLLRGQIWNETEVAWWYRQNIMLFVKQEKTNVITTPPPPSVPLSLVHPELYLSRTSLWKVCKISLRNTLKKILGKRISGIIRKHSRPTP